MLFRSRFKADLDINKMIKKYEDVLRGYIEGKPTLHGIPYPENCQERIKIEQYLAELREREKNARPINNWNCL